MLKIVGSRQFKITNKNRRANKILKRSALALAIGQTLLLPAQAADILVNVTNDVDAADMNCTLREAVRSADINDGEGRGCIAGSAMGIDTISFDPNLAGTTITLTQASTVEINSNISINGLGRDQLAVSGSGNAGVFYIRSNPMVTIQDITIRDASAGTGNVEYDGAGIRVAEGSLDLKNCNISNNITQSSGGGVFVQTGANLTVEGCSFYNNIAEYGGALVARDSVSISNSTFRNNSATSRAGAIDLEPFPTATSPTLTISNSTIVNNSAPFAAGVRVIGSNGLMVIRNSTISGNSASTRGGGVYSNLGGSITIANSIVSGNQAPTGAEVLAQTLGEITGNNNNIFGEDSLNAAAAFYRLTPGMTDIVATNDNPAAAAALQDIILFKEGYDGDEAYFILPDGSPALAAANPTVCSSAPVNGLDQRGFSRDANCDIGATEFTTATLMVNSRADGTGGHDCTMASAMLSANRRTADGGCARGGDGTTINFDPAVFPSNANNIILLSEPLEEIQTSTVTINGRGNPGVTLQAVAGGNAADESIIDVDDSIISVNKLVLARGSQGLTASSNSTAYISNSTIINNVGANYGAGVEAVSASRLFINNSTIVNNTATRGGGGFEIYNGSYLRLTNSTVSGNSQTDSSSSFGGGAMDLDGGSYGVSVVIINSTITGNYAATVGGGPYIYADNIGSLTITNSIISGNSAAGSAQEIFVGANSVTSTGNNLFGSSESTRAAAFDVSSGVFPSATDIDASSDYLNLPIASIIEPLADNGGFTQTHALARSSRAIDAASNALCVSAGISTDQRGNPRNDGRCDIGAFEFADGESCYVVKAANGQVLAFCL